MVRPPAPLLTSKVARTASRPDAGGVTGAVDETFAAPDWPLTDQVNRSRPLVRRSIREDRWAAPAVSQRPRIAWFAAGVQVSGVISARRSMSPVICNAPSGGVNTLEPAASSSHVVMTTRRLARG